MDKGFIDLINHCGGDISVVNSARISFAKRVEVVSKADEKLIEYLMRERHGTPFEHNLFTFHVKAPIFVTREWQRHRIGSYNEMSGRYMELPADWYIPLIPDVRSRVGKPGHYTYEKSPAMTGATFVHALQLACKSSYEDYKKALALNVAPEQARMFLHVNHYTEFYWTVNARSLMNFISLRAAETAQKEIRDYAFAVEKMFASKMPVTFKAFTDNNRIAP